MTKTCRTILTLAVVAVPLGAQTEASHLRPILEEEILAPQVAVFQLRQYILRRVAKPHAPTSAEQWTAESATLRKRLLNDVVFQGWPREWVEAPPKFEEVGMIAGNGYRYANCATRLFQVLSPLLSFMNRKTCTENCPRS